MSFLRRFKISPILLLFNVILLCLFLINQKIEVPFLYYWFISLVLFEVIDVSLAVAAFFQAKGIRVSREVSDHAVEGQTITAEIVLQNLSGFSFCNVSLEDAVDRIARERLKRSFLPLMGKRRARRITYDIGCHTRGKYPLDPGWSQAKSQRMKIAHIGDQHALAGVDARVKGRPQHGCRGSIHDYQRNVQVLR